VELWATRQRRPSSAANPQGSPRPPTPPPESCNPKPGPAGARYRSEATGRCQCAPPDRWTSSYFKLRHSRSTKTLSHQRPRPSMLIRTPAVSSLSVNAPLVNCAPWSVLKISGCPFPQGVFKRIEAERSVHRVRQAPRQDVAAAPVGHRDQVEEAACHWDISNVGGPHLVRPIDRQAVQQVGIDPVLCRRPAGLRLWAWAQRFEPLSRISLCTRLRLT